MMAVEQMSMVQPVLGNWRSGSSLAGSHTYSVQSLIYNIPRYDCKKYVDDTASAGSLEQWSLAGAYIYSVQLLIYTIPRFDRKTDVDDLSSAGWLMSIISHLKKFTR